jgi:DNA-3-methyladenine glycosylase II
MVEQVFAIAPHGPFSLAEAAGFGFGQRAGADWDRVMRMAFCLDGYSGQVGVEVRQDDSGVVHGLVSGPDGTDVDAVSRQVARVLSLDHDGEEFVRIGQRDQVIGQLQKIAPGLRPPLFYSPYEAAAWAVLSARRPARQMQQIRQRLSEAHGEVFELAGQRLAAFPSPRQLLSVPSFPGVPQDKIRRLHGVADAALAGTLDVGNLRALGPAQAMAELQQINGIGPFYSALIVIRGTGFTDVLPVQEPRALALTAQLYQLDAPPGPEEFARIAEPWRPFRTWAVVLIRAAAGRIFGEAEAQALTADPGGEAFQAERRRRVQAELTRRWRRRSTRVGGRRGHCGGRIPRSCGTGSSAGWGNARRARSA